VRAATAVLCSSPTPPCRALFTLSLHDALPIFPELPQRVLAVAARDVAVEPRQGLGGEKEDRHAEQGERDERHLPAEGQAEGDARSEEHTSELQSPDHLVCRLLLEKKKNKTIDA